MTKLRSGSTGRPTGDALLGSNGTSVIDHPRLEQHRGLQQEETPVAQHLPHAAIVARVLWDDDREEAVDGARPRRGCTRGAPHEVLVGARQPLQRSRVGRHDAHSAAAGVEPGLAPDGEGGDVLRADRPQVRDAVARRRAQVRHQEHELVVASTSRDRRLDVQRLATTQR